MHRSSSKSIRFALASVFPCCKTSEDLVGEVIRIDKKVTIAAELAYAAINPRTNAVNI